MVLMSDQGDAGPTLPYRYVPRNLRYGTLAVVPIPLLLGVMLLAERAQIEPSSLGEARGNLLVGFVSMMLIAATMIWRTFAQRLVVTDERIIVGNYFMTYAIRWESITAIALSEGLPIDANDGSVYASRYQQIRLRVHRDCRQHFILVQALTRKCRTETLNQEPMQLLRSAAPERLDGHIIRAVPSGPWPASGTTS